MFTFSTSTDDEKDNETLQKPEVSQFVETSCFWFRPTGVKKKAEETILWSCEIIYVIPWPQQWLFHCRPWSASIPMTLVLMNFP